MLFNDTYHMIESSSEGLFKDKGSKFISYAFPVLTEEDVKTKLNDVKKEHPLARHHCYAYILNPDKSKFRINDDGEPAGTAGKPIYNQLLSKDLTNILVIVVRYFGGTLLGVPGLINAYKLSAADALEKATLLEKHITEKYSLTFGYDLLSYVMRIAKEYNAEIVHQVQTEKCTMHFGVRKLEADKFTEAIKKAHEIEVKYISTY